MSATATILGCGIVDDVGIQGTRGTNVKWQDLGVAAPGTGRTMRDVFDKADATFRRIDQLARGLVLGCEAADIERLLTEEQRQSTAIVIETDIGALLTDKKFAASLQDECVAAAVFPYSLTSTSLGEVALRYGLRGPSISLSVTATERGASLRESLRLLHAGDADHVISGMVDALPESSNGHPATMRAAVGVLARDGAGVAQLKWPNTATDAFELFASMCR